MGQYYFLVSSLPFLLKESNVQLTVSDFQGLCRQQLTKSDFEIIEKCKLDNFNLDEIINNTFSKWQLWEINLRNELLKLRAQKKGIGPEKYFVSCERVIEVDEIAKSVFNQVSPLEAENMLDNARWDFLDSIEVGNYFNIDKLVLYSLKLQLLEKKAAYNKNEGTEEFNKLKQVKLEKIKSGENVYD